MTIERGDAVALAAALVRVDSRNPSLAEGAPGERDAARLLAETLSAWGLDVEVVDAAPGRPNVIARAAGKGGGRSLMFNGHLDTVATERMRHEPLSAELRDGRLYGRGSADMKGGVAAMSAAAVRAQDAGISGEIVVAAVADEEYESVGTSALLRRGVRTDGAIVAEPTQLAIAPAHRGFVWLEVVVRGRAAHGSRYDIGIDAIRHAGLVLAELDRLEQETLGRNTHPLLGHGSLHASLIEGGIGMSTYPDRCTFRIERRTLPGETAQDAVREVRSAIAWAQDRRPELVAEVRLTLAQGASDVAISSPIVQSLEEAITESGESARIEGMSAWTDAALLNEAGIPAICFGPGDISLAHSAEEWVSVSEIERATDVLARFASRWCGG